MSKPKSAKPQIFRQTQAHEYSMLWDRKGLSKLQNNAAYVQKITSLKPTIAKVISLLKW